MSQSLLPMWGEGIALRIQLSVDPWGCPGAMAGASLLRAGVEAS